MRVVVRVRPFNDAQIDQRCVVKVLDDTALMFDPKEEVEHFYFRGAKQMGRDLSRKANKELRFTFDAVFDDDATNEQIHRATTMPILDEVLNGYNCSVFAYGATGSGKTFTMLGNKENPGITFLTVMQLFERLEALRSDKIIDLAVSYLEVYNENVKDLLTTSGILQLREDPHRGVIVPGLSLHKPKGAEELLEMLRLGNSRRTQHPTDANAESSRSHAVFTVYLKQQDRAVNGSKSLMSATRVCKLALIDLAGSERASMVSRGNGSRLREGANINKSLLALGNCINALADRKVHVPFRNSKLTRLLKDSLDGNSRTVMIAAISPTVANYEDTYNTLKYATRAKHIKTNSKQNVFDLVVPAGQHMMVIKELQEQVANLKMQLSRVPTISAPLVSIPSATDAPVITLPVPQKKKAAALSDELQEIQSRLAEIFGKREVLMRQFLEVLCRVREIELRIQRRQQCTERLALISVNSNLMDHSSSKVDIALARMAERRDRQLTQRKALQKLLAENSAELGIAKGKAAQLDSEVLNEWLETQHYKFELTVSQFREHHARRAAVVQAQETTRSDRLLSEILKVVQRQYLVLLANSLATSDITEDFDALIKQVKGFKEVAWADQTNENNAEPGQLNIGSILRLSISHLDIQARADSSEETRSTTSDASSELEQPKMVLKTAIVCPSLMDSTFSKDEFKMTDVTTNGNNLANGESESIVRAQVDVEKPSSSRRLTFDAVEPSTSQSADSEKENMASTSSMPPACLKPAVSAARDKRQWVDTYGNDKSSKKMKPSVSVSDLSTTKSLRKFGFPSMFDKSTKQVDAQAKIKIPTFGKALKSTPSKRNILEPINNNGKGSAFNTGQISASIRLPIMKSFVKPASIAPRTNALSRQRSKSTTSLKTE